MNQRLGDHFVAGIFILFAIAGIGLAWVVSQDATWRTFDVIQGTHVFGIDDIYRRFLSQTPFRESELWIWDFLLPVNVAFDALLAWATDNSIFLMRSAHFLIVLVGQYLVYRAGRHLGISPLWMGASCLLLLLMPFYLLHAMSFYGESLLTAVMGMAVYALIVNRSRVWGVLISLFPLIRPEGLFYLFCTVFQQVREKNYSRVVLIAFPGFVFLCALLFAFPFLEGFMEWRHALTSHYALVPEEVTVMGRASMPYYTINPAWWILAACGAFLPMLRPLSPLFLGAVIFAVLWAVACLMGTARGETRYFLPMLPLLSLAFAAMLNHFSRSDWLQDKAWLKVAAGLLTCVVVLLENLAQLDPVRANVFADRRWPVAGEPGAGKFFRLTPPEETQWRKDAASFLEAYTKYDPGIDKIIVSAFPVFYNLDTKGLPERVKVEFAPMHPEATKSYYGNEFYAMFPSLPQYRFYRFYPIHQQKAVSGKNQALYVGPLYNGVHPPLFANPLYQVYKVRYQAIDKKVARP